VSKEKVRGNCYRIVLTDDCAIIRKKIREMIEEMAGLKVVGEVSDGVELLNLLEKLTADLIILDISMPRLSGIKATQEIKKIYPDVKILILTTHNDKEYLHHAFSSGANGYLLKEDSGRELYSAIEKIRRGEIYISRRLSKELEGN